MQCVRCPQCIVCSALLRFGCSTPLNGIIGTLQLAKPLLAMDGFSSVQRRGDVAEHDSVLSAAQRDELRAYVSACYKSSKVRFRCRFVCPWFFVSFKFES